jgi:hypothetical protein
MVTDPCAGLIGVRRTGVLHGETTMTDTDKTTRKRSFVGESLHAHGEAVDHCEALYLQHEGEVTDEIEAAEAAVDLTRAQAMEALARYLRWCDDRDDQHEREKAATAERLARFKAGTDRRRAWASERLTALVRERDPRAKKAQAGTFAIGLRDTDAVEVEKGADLSQCPAAWVRQKPPVTPPPEVDKTTAKADLLLGYREGEPPCAGWYDVDGHGRAHLGQDENGRWFIEQRGEACRICRPLSAAGLSIEPQPGLDVLRWKPSPPGVTLVHRVHVKVS